MKIGGSEATVWDEGVLLARSCLAAMTCTALLSHVCLQRATQNGPLVQVHYIGASNREDAFLGWLCSQADEVEAGHWGYALDEPLPSTS